MNNEMIYDMQYGELEEERACTLIDIELNKAVRKHPGWPRDIIHAVAIMIEEAGEAMQAAIDCQYAGGSVEKLKTELAQCGAMCIRTLMHLDVGNSNNYMINANRDLQPCDPPPFVHADKSFPTDGGIIREMYKK